VRRGRKWLCRKQRKTKIPDQTGMEEKKSTHMPPSLSQISNQKYPSRNPSKKCNPKTAVYK